MKIVYLLISANTYKPFRQKLTVGIASIPVPTFKSAYIYNIVQQ